ncbi:MAG: universal stress protein [Methanobacteriaceae archaeon]|jgi:nucleotide-binding universal stress UspA family protein|nr:universal stress protein [Methanobacteriaceae archaeon]
MFENIMVPVDGSKYNDKAIEIAIEMALKFNSKIIAVHVLEEFSKNSYTDDEDSGDDILANVTNKAKVHNIDVIEHLITGDPLRDMKTIIRKSGTDLVIISSKGKDEIKNKELENHFGSVASRVIKNSDIPILLIGSS